MGATPLPVSPGVTLVPPWPLLACTGFSDLDISGAPLGATTSSLEQPVTTNMSNAKSIALAVMVIFTGRNMSNKSNALGSRSQMFPAVRQGFLGGQFDDHLCAGAAMLASELLGALDTDVRQVELPHDVRTAFGDLDPA